jgi:uncharacterized protein (DUF934 family)
MPRRLLRDGRVVADDWLYLAEIGGDAAGSAAHGAFAIAARGTAETGSAALEPASSGSGAAAPGAASSGAAAAAGAGYESGLGSDAGIEAAARAAAGVTNALILTFDQWLADKPRWVGAAGRLGVVLSPAHKVEALAPDLAHFALIGADFPGPGEGRGYTQARLLRERYHWRGELRAVGYVRRDQLFFMARCGFNSFELAAADLATAGAAFSTFSAEYQPSNDLGLPHKLLRRSLPA